jgi:hypothetical protein
MTSSPPTTSTGSLSEGTYEFELQVTDSSTGPYTVTSNAVTVKVTN